MNLSYQILNLRLLLSRAMSDRYLSQDLHWATSPGSSFQSIKGQAVLGFQISIDAQHAYRDAVAEVEIKILSGTSLAQKMVLDARKILANPKDEKAKAEAQAAVARFTAEGVICDQSGPVSLVSLLPREKTYNVASISRKAQSVGFGAVVQVVNVGFTASRSKETMYLVKDTDTVALEGRPTDDAISFKYQFRPVLGRHVVEPGQRQVFATIALPTSARCGFGGNIVVTTRWRKYDRNSGAVKDEIPHSTDTDTRVLAIPALALLENSLRPKIGELQWTDAGGGQIVAWATGEAFLRGTAIVLGDSLFGAGSPAFVKQGEFRWRLTLPAAKLAMIGDAQLVGDYGTPEPLQSPAARIPEGMELAYPRLKIEPTIKPGGADQSAITVSVSSSTPTAYVYDYQHPLVVLIGNRLFGLSDAPVQVEKKVGPDGKLTGVTILSFKAPNDLFTANDLVTVMEFFRGRTIAQRRSSLQRRSLRQPRSRSSRSATPMCSLPSLVPDSRRLNLASPQTARP
jgi:hypothetical protein